MNITVADAFDGSTVNTVLRSCGASGTLIKLLKTRPHGITVNGEDVTVRHRVFAGDVISADDGDRYEDENEYVIPSEDKIEILYEDENVFVLNKPSGMPTHTSHGHYADTLANALAAEYRRRGKPFVFRPVNRLDCDTSGVVIAAKSRLSASVMARHMEARRIRKTYIAVLDGELPLACGETAVIKSYIRRKEDTIILRESVPLDSIDPDDTDDPEPGDYAETVYKCLCKDSMHSIVEASPVTGRTHQLRVHFSSVGHPITGDELYGGERTLIGRQALHALKIEFPTGNDTVTVRSPIPEDIMRLIAEIENPLK